MSLMLCVSVPFRSLQYDASVKEGKLSSEEKSNIDNQKLLQKYSYYYKVSAHCRHAHASRSSSCAVNA